MPDRINKANLGALPGLPNADQAKLDPEKYNKAYSEAYKQLLTNDKSKKNRNLAKVKAWVEDFVQANFDGDSVYAEFMFRSICRLIENGKISVELVSTDEQISDMLESLVTEKANSGGEAEAKIAAIREQGTRLKLTWDKENFAFTSKDTNADTNIYNFLLKIRSLETLQSDLNKQLKEFKENSEQAINAAGIGSASSLSKEIVENAYQEAIEYLKQNPRKILEDLAVNNAIQIPLANGRTLNFLRVSDMRLMLIMEVGDLRADNSTRNLERLRGSKNTFTPVFRLDQGIEMYGCRESEFDAKTFASEVAQINQLRSADGILQEYVGVHGPEQKTRKLYAPLIPDDLSAMLEVKVEGLSGKQYEPVAVDLGSTFSMYAYNHEIMQKLIASFANLHKNGIEHGDFKPEHLLIGYDAQSKELYTYLMDFDRARNFGSDLKLDGSPAYYSPEMLQLEFGGLSIDEAKKQLLQRANNDQSKVDQILNSYAWHILTKNAKPGFKIPKLSQVPQVSGASDIFSLGLTLYQIASGKVLDGTTNDRVLFAEIDKACAKPDSLLAGMLRQDAALRYDISKAQEVFNALSPKPVSKATELPQAQQSADTHISEQMSETQYHDLDSTVARIIELCTNANEQERLSKVIAEFKKLDLDPSLLQDIAIDIHALNDANNLLLDTMQAKYQKFLLPSKTKQNEQQWGMHLKTQIVAEAMLHLIQQHMQSHNLAPAKPLQAARAIYQHNTQIVPGDAQFASRINRLVTWIQDAEKYEGKYARQTQTTTNLGVQPGLKR